MSTNIDNPPVYDPITIHGDELSYQWRDYISTLIQTLQSYLSPQGLFIPRITTEERNSLIDVQEGQLIYNSTLKKFQGYENGAWVNLV